LPITVLGGRRPAPGSLTSAAVTLGYVRRLALTRAQANRVVGTEIELASPRFFRSVYMFRGRWTRAVIVGVVAQQAASGQIVAPIEQTRIARTWVREGDPSNQFGADPSPYSALFVIAEGLGRVSADREGSDWL